MHHKEECRAATTQVGIMSKMTERSIMTRSNVSDLVQVHNNLSIAALVETALRRGEAELASNGAISARTGPRTGRSPRDRFIVRNAASEDVVDWGRVNQPIDQNVYEQLRERVLDYAGERDVFLLDTVAGADTESALPVRVITERAWHNLFAKQLFLRQRSGPEGRAYGFTVISMPGFHPEPERDGTNTDAAIVLDFEQREVLICGTEYAGEIKKSIFSVMNMLLPQSGIFPMHCSANKSQAGDVALFFGLSGTGKTSLSSDPERQLIGDDEHGWNDRGVFNFEGGCYAKCIHLRREHEPQIYDAIRFGAVMENVVIDPQTREPDYDDASLTENTRVAYPLEFIPNTAPGALGGHPRTIFFLTADAFGVLPPIARLTSHQAMYHFLSGYTAKLAGTEVGLGREPQATFEACFGAPFLPLPAPRYAEMLRDRVEQHRTSVYLLNTGWTGGPAGIGQRIPIGYTRAMVRAALVGQLEQTDLLVDPRFGLHVPRAIDGVPQHLMQPRETWSDREAYDQAAERLATLFVDNFRQFGGQALPLAQHGPHV
jgi:phosphoenolpyruvate carboxykinase (ATP)